MNPLVRICLGLIHGPIGIVDELIERFTVLRVQAHANAHADVQELVGVG